MSGFWAEYNEKMEAGAIGSQSDLRRELALLNCNTLLFLLGKEDSEDAAFFAELTTELKDVIRENGESAHIRIRSPEGFTPKFTLGNIHRGLQSRGVEPIRLL